MAKIRLDDLLKLAWLPLEITSFPFGYLFGYCAISTVVRYFMPNNYFYFKPFSLASKTCFI